MRADGVVEVLGACGLAGHGDGGPGDPGHRCGDDLMPECVEGAERRRVMAVAGERDVDDGHGPGAVGAHRDRPGHLPGGGRLVLEGSDAPGKACWTRW